MPQVAHAPKDFRLLRRLVVTQAPRLPRAGSCRGRLIAGPVVIGCSLGARGIVHDKREGDGGTPAGRWRLLAGFFRSDRLGRPRSILALAALNRTQGWCDDPGASLYNKPIRLPSRQRHERLWRDDRLYNIIVILDYNMKPCRKGRGSAIFFHIASATSSATAGCVAIAEPDMRRLLPRLGPGSVMLIR